MINVGDILLDLWNGSGFAALTQGFLSQGGWQNLVMIIIACGLLYLGIVKKFEPLLLVGIAFGCLLSNLPLGGLYHQELWDAFMDANSPAYHSYGAILRDAGLIVVMDQGRIVEQGTHEELLARKGKYYELYMTQYAGFAT